MNRKTMKIRRSTGFTVLPAALAPVLVWALAIALPLPASAGDTSPAQAAFDEIEALAGSWSATGMEGQPVRIDYQVVGNGSAVVEHFSFPEGDPGQTMVTVYHLDGDELVLTHYCMAGNQPTMRATSYGGGGSESVDFELSAITNLASPDAGHMHRARFEFGGRDRFSTRWTYRKDGEDAFTEVIEAERVAAVRNASTATPAQ